MFFRDFYSVRVMACIPWGYSGLMIIIIIFSSPLISFASLKKHVFFVLLYWCYFHHTLRGIFVFCMQQFCSVCCMFHRLSFWIAFLCESLLFLFLFLLFLLFVFLFLCIFLFCIFLCVSHFTRALWGMHPNGDEILWKCKWVLVLGGCAKSAVTSWNQLT